MNNKVAIVYDIWKSHDNYLGKKSVTPDFAAISQYFANLFCPGDFYYYVIDSPTLTFDIVSPSVEKLLGIAPKDFSLPGLTEIIHPDDIIFLMKCEDIVAYFLKNCIAPDKMVKYKISYCLREKTKQKGYRLFLLQTITMKTTEDGALLKVFGSHTDITHITDVNNHKLSFIGLDGEPSYLEIDVFNNPMFNEYKPYDLQGLKTASPFSRRELEVIKLMATGLSTDKIAGELFVSKNTIETHRKNILKKSGCNNTTELVAQCIRKGYI